MASRKGCKPGSLCYGVPVEYGCQGLDALRSRTVGNPWFAVISGVVHGGQVEYAAAQAAGEYLADLGPEQLSTVAEVTAALKSPALPPGAGRGITVVADRIAAAARAYLRWGPKRGEKLTKRHLENITHAVCDECRPDDKRAAINAKMGPAEKTGIGRKAGALMREYLGDDNAVAADRHIMDFVFRHTGKGGELKLAKMDPDDRREIEARIAAGRFDAAVVPAARSGGAPRVVVKARGGHEIDLTVRPWKRGDQITKADFALGERVIRELARECGITPAQFQVAVWLQSACAVKGRGVGYQLPLSKGAYFDCGLVLGQKRLPGLGSLGTGAAHRRTFQAARAPDGAIVLV